MKIELNKIVSPSRALIGLYIFCGLLIWAATYVGSFFEWGISYDVLLSKLSDSDLLWRNIVSSLLTLLNSILLFRLIGRFSFVRARTFLPVFVFALLIAVWEPAHPLYQSHLALLLFICALFQFFNMHESPKVTENAFLGSLLLGVASLFINDLVFILPVCWLGFLALQTLSVRTFLASLLGGLVPWVFYLVINFIISPYSDISDFFNINILPGFSMRSLQIPTQIYIGLLFLIFLVSLFGTYADFHKNGSKTRKNINFILILLFYFLFIFIFQGSFSGVFFPFIALCFSIFISNVFSMKRENFYSVLFLSFVFLNIVFVAYNFLF